MDKKTTDRRNFLRLSALGTAGLIAAPYMHKRASASTFSIKPPDERKFIYRTLGKTGIKVPIISTGAIPNDNDNLAKAILESGIVHVDTAHVYGSGKNEEVLGKMLKNYPRDKFVIATKIYPPMDKETGLLTDEATEEKFREDFEVSMKRLGLDYVDILYLHSAKNKETTLHPMVLRVLKDLKEKGRTRFIGVSTHRNEPEVIQAAIDSKAYDVVLTAYNYQQEQLVDVKSAIKKANEAGLGIVAMKTQAGKYLDKEKTKPVNDTAAIKWALQDENVHTAILTIRSYDKLEEYLEVMEKLKFTRKEKRFIQSHDSGSLYCPGCEKCLKQCRKNLSIPDIMRAYMYTYGYGDLAKAQDVLASLGVDSKVCSDCGICTVQCAKGFDVKDKIRDVARLTDVPRDFIA